MLFVELRDVKRGKTERSAVEYPQNIKGEFGSVVNALCVQDVSKGNYCLFVSKWVLLRVIRG